MSKTVTIKYDKKREYEFYEILKNSFKNVSINDQINRFYLEVTRQIKNKENEEEHEFVCKKSYYNLAQYPYLKSDCAVHYTLFYLNVNDVFYYFCLLAPSHNQISTLRVPL